MGFGVQDGAIFAGRYRVIRRLAAGAMGAVYEAEHLGTGRRRALKVMHAHTLERPELRERFKLEARVTAGITSEFIVEVFDAGIDEETGTPFLVMELLSGEELGQRLRRVGRFSPEEALGYLHQTSLALEETHKASIVHRDLKPGNLFVVERAGRDPVVKVLDFGVAKIVAESATSGGATMAVGTPHYMAPEQFRGGKVSPATDIYALGMIAYTLLVGEAYWADEKKESDNLLSFAIIAGRGPKELASVRAGRRGALLPAEFDGWFARATAAQPARRFASAIEAVGALADVFGLPRPAVRAPPAIEDVARERAPDSSASTREPDRDRTLRDYIGEHTVPLGRRVRWLVDLARVLAAAHRAERVHGKLTPEGVLVRLDGSLKVPGLEVARPDESTIFAGGTLTGTGPTGGSPGYLAPEQLVGQPIDRRTDQFTWGVMAYELLSGAPPWGGDDPDGLRDRVLSRAPEPLRERVPEAPEELDRAVLRALEKRPEDRYPTLEDAASAIEPFADEVASRRRDEAATIAAEVEATRENTGEFAATQGSGGSARTQGSRAGPGAWRRGAKVAAAFASALAIGLGAAALRPRPQPMPPPLSPPRSPTFVLACPILRASGVEEPPGWLGAAAAATVCERARFILGGRASQTLVPAELLGLPRQPVDAFPVDPYAGPEARARSLGAAQRRATAYVDGEVVKEASGFRVTLALHRGEGGELARATGSGRSLYRAVREAMTPLVGPDLLPRASALDPGVADWSRTRDIDSALVLLDVTLAIAQNAGGLAEECARLDDKSADLGEMGPGERWLCAYTLGSPPPPLPLFPTDPASPAAYVTRARMNHRTDRTRDREVSAELDGLLKREQSDLGRSMIAATESCLLQSSDPKRAYEAAFMAVQADPKNPMGDLCSPWVQLAAMAQDTPSADSTQRAMQAWTPWDSLAWSTPPPGDAERALAYARRAYVLTPFDTSAANVLADLLFERGSPGDVQNIALEMRLGGHPVHALDSELLLVRLDASKARFRDALARARPAMEIARGESGWVQVLRFEVGWRAVEIAAILGRAPELADLVVERFVDPEPPPLNAVETAVTAHIPAVCARASREVGRRCFARFEALRGRLSRGPETDTFTRGAERYAAGDLRGAAGAWRPLMAQPGVFASVLPDAMAAAFEATGDVELVEKLTARAEERARELGGASPVMVVAARRAEKKGDRAGARRWAEKVIRAWQVADEAPPAVEEMKRLRDRPR
jgi:serine/threonine protein kinase